MFRAMKICEIAAKNAILTKKSVKNINRKDNPERDVPEGKKLHKTRQEKTRQYQDQQRKTASPYPKFTPNCKKVRSESKKQGEIAPIQAFRLFLAILAFFGAFQSDYGHFRVFS